MIYYGKLGSSLESIVSPRTCVKLHVCIDRYKLTATGRAFCEYEYIGEETIFYTMVIIKNVIGRREASYTIPNASILCSLLDLVSREFKVEELGHKL